MALGYLKVLGYGQMLFRRKAPANPVAISLDIGTEFAKALVFEVRDGVGYVLGAAKARQRLSDMQGGYVTDIAGVVQTCATALDEAFAQAECEAEQVVVGIAGELVKGTTTATTLVRENPQSPLTEPELRTLIAEAQQRTLPRTRAELARETGYSEIDVQLVNSAVVGVKIDGYRVTNPVGFPGRQVEVEIYTSYAPNVHFGALQRIVDDLGLDLVVVATEPYAVARSLGDAEAGDISSICIDVGGGTTDIAVVRSGGLEGTKMFALGGRVFTKRIAKEEKISFGEAEKRKIAYSEGNLSEEDAKRTREQLAGDVDVWLAGVELALEEFATSERFADNPLLPARINLCGGGSLLPDLAEALKKKKWAKVLPFAKQPEVRFLLPSEVSGVRDTTGNLTSSQDVTPMALANVALDHVGTEAVVSGALNQFVKGLSR